MTGRRGQGQGQIAGMRWAGPSCRSPRRGGQILVLTILAMTMLASLIFYVYNVGDQVNRRIVMQDAADSVAVSGAGWMARSMNLVAMNNVSQSRMIALALVQDSLPLAAEMALAEETGQNALPDALEKWRIAGAPFTPYEKDNFYRKGLAELYRQMTGGSDGRDTGEHYDKRQLELLRQIDEAFDSDDEKTVEGGYDMTLATHWTTARSGGTAPQGSIWRAAVALDESSQAAVESAGMLAQSNAVSFGRANAADAAFLVPVLPRFPGRRGTFNDFRALFMNRIRAVYDPITAPPKYSIVKSNLVSRLERSQDVPWDAPGITVRGGAVSDEIGKRQFWALGPFFRVYRWRDYSDQYDLPWWEASRRRDRVEYSSYGPLEDALRTVSRQFGGVWARGSVDTTRFAYHLQTIAKVKLAYLFGLSWPQKIQYADEWIVDYDEAARYVQEHAGETPRPVMTTRYYRVYVKSTVPWTDTEHWMETYENAPPTATYTPRRYHSHQLRKPFGQARRQPLYRWIYDSRGWNPVVGSWQKLTDYVWYRKRQWSVRDDYDLNLPPRYVLDNKGKPVLGDDDQKKSIPYTIYSMEWRVFGGIELRNEQELSNPLAGAAVDDLPAPFLIETDDEQPEEFEAVDPETGWVLDAARFEPFRYLAVVRKGAAAAVWPQRFESSNPTDSLFTMAQAKVFNNSSWDLWTQDWQVQLTRIADWQDWCDQLERGQDDAALTEGLVPTDDVERAHGYMTAFPPEMADRYINH